MTSFHRFFSFLAVTVSVFVQVALASSPNVVPKGLLPNVLSVWKTEDTFAYRAKDKDGQFYLWAVDRRVRHELTKEWAGTMTPFMEKEPILFMWLDKQYDIKKALVLENGEVRVSDGALIFEVVSTESDSPYGMMRVTLFDEHDVVQARRDFRTILVPAPSNSQCTLQREQPWIVGYQSAGKIEYWTCPSKGKHAVKIVGISSNMGLPAIIPREIIFQTWNLPNGKRFAAMSLENGDRVVDEIYDTLPYFHWGEDAPESVLMQFYLKPTLYQRVIPLQPRLEE